MDRGLEGRRERKWERWMNSLMDKGKKRGNCTWHMVSLNSLINIAKLKTFVFLTVDKHI